MISQWKRWLLPAYYYGTWPLRRAGSWLADAAGMQPLSVLFYHRVADVSPSPWTITNREFARQVDWLSKHFELISLQELQQRIEAGKNSRPAVSITFDDGYAENCERALPLLISRRIPVTYFVATEFVRTGQPFPHDVERGDPRPPNTVEQLRSLAAAGVEIAAHTRRHVDLGKVRQRRGIEDEILGSRDDLQNWLGRAVRYFAFPYGQAANLNPLAFEVARNAGFAGVCSAYGGYNLPGRDPFHIQRLHGDPDFTRLRNWLTFEPRVLAGTRPFSSSSCDSVASNSSTASTGRNFVDQETVANAERSL